MRKRVLILFLIICVYCSLCAVGFAEESTFAPQDLVSQIPDAAYTGDTETIETVAQSNNDIQQLYWSYADILFDRLYDAGLIPKDMEEFKNAPTEEEMAACPQVSVEDVCKTFDRLFGPNASSVLRINERDSGWMIGTGSESLLLSKDKKSFVYVPYFYGGGVFGGTRKVFQKSETAGEDLILYTKFSYFAPYADIYFYIEESVRVGSKSLISLEESDWKSVDVDPWDLLDSGAFDKYFPTYKHTFKPNGDGTYYWASTVKEADGEKIPLSVVHESLPAKISEKLLAQVPHGAYNMQQKITFENLPGSSAPNVSSILINRLHALGYLKNDKPGDIKGYPADTTLETVPLQTVKVVFDSLFGVGSFDNLPNNEIFVFNNQLSFIKSEGVYVYHSYNGSSDASCEFREEILDSTFSGNDYIVKVRYCLFGFYGGAKDELCSLMGDNSVNSNLQYTPLAYVEKDRVQDFREGAYDAYSPIYTLTFKSNGRGSYYWYSTEMTEAPKQIPENMVHSYPSPTTDAITDVSTGSATNVVPQEEGSSAVWIVVAVVAVAAVAAAAVFFVLKKKKA